jgi:hypothetical protein
MATITKSIGTGRDYASVSAWLADKSNAAIYAAGDVMRGEVYGTLAMAQVSPSVGSIALSSMVLTGAPSNRHTGSPGTGAKLVCNTSTATNLFLLIPSSTMTIEISWLEIDLNDLTPGAVANNGGFNSASIIIHHNLIHNYVGLNGGGANGIISDAGRRARIYCNKIWDIENAASAGVSGIVCSSTFEAVCYNNTVHNIRCTAGTGNAFGIQTISNANAAYKNNVVTGVTGPTPTCYSPSSVPLAAASNNIASDATAPGTSSQNNVTASSLYVNATAGSEDLHLKAGSPAIDGGADLSATGLTDITLDIDGVARAGVWDCGADEYVSVSAFKPFFRRQPNRVHGSGVI